MRARSTARIAVIAVIAMALTPGCSAKFDLPTERHITEPIPTDQSYAMIATWDGLTGVQDVLLTQGSGSQLFLLFNRGGTGGPSTPRGDVQLYPFTRPAPIGPPYFLPPTTLFNPIALTAAQGKLFVLDQGDSCLARYSSVFGTCEASQANNNTIQDLSAYWHVREYSLSGGDTISTFTDTTFAQVYGVAADEQGRVYVSGIAVVLDTLATDQRIRTRKFVSRVYRYLRGPRYPGIIPGDRYMPGSNWHRDTTWVVFDGSGNSSVADPRGIVWSSLGSTSLFIADKGNNQAKVLSVNQIGVGFVKIDGGETGANFDSPEDVAMDLQGYLYAVDRNNHRVVRYTPGGNYVQNINVEPNSEGLPLLDPVAVGVDDSVAYVADRGRGQVIRYKRRP